jgi:hypothetical protein
MQMCVDALQRTSSCSSSHAATEALQKRIAELAPTTNNAHHFSSSGATHPANAAASAAACAVHDGWIGPAEPCALKQPLARGSRPTLGSPTAAAPWVRKEPWGGTEVEWGMRKGFGWEAGKEWGEHEGPGWGTEVEWGVRREGEGGEADWGARRGSRDGGGSKIEESWASAWPRGLFEESADSYSSSLSATHSPPPAAAAAAAASAEGAPAAAASVESGCSGMKREVRCPSFYADASQLALSCEYRHGNVRYGERVRVSGLLEAYWIACVFIVLRECGCRSTCSELLVEAWGT